MLIDLPRELLCHVYQLLTHSSVNQMSLTCRSLYISTLPVLYTTVVLSYRTHIRQLEAGLQKSDGALKHILQQHTKKLVLKCKHSGQHSLLFDIRSLLFHLPHLRSLNLVDFHMLPVDYITPLLSRLPNLDTVSLQYCDLITDVPCVTGLSRNIPLPTSHQQRYQNEQHPGDLKQHYQQSRSVTTLEFYWTDFSKAAVSSILSVFPSVTKIHLLANHNRHFLANNYALDAVQKHCPHIKDLEIGLQEVKEQTLVDCIMFYGIQLRRLSIRYYSPYTLFAVTKYASLVQDLTIRFSLETKWYPSASLLQPPPTTHSFSASATQHRLPSLPYTTTRPHIYQRQRQQYHLRLQQELDQEIRKKGALLCVLCQCHRLMRVQVESMRPTQSRDNLPLVVRKALDIVAQKRITRINDNHHSYAFKDRIQNLFPVKHQQYPANQITANSDVKTVVLAAATTSLSSSTMTTAIDKYQLQQNKQNDNTEFDTTTTNSNTSTNPRLGFSPQRSRPWKNDLSTRMETILVLDKEQLKEIRSQALPME